jgi:hypothetical protein
MARKMRRKLVLNMPGKISWTSPKALRDRQTLHAPFTALCSNDQLETNRSIAIEIQKENFWFKWYLPRHKSVENKIVSKNF